MTMPEHKLNMNAAEETVPLDDTGPEVDVDIDEGGALPIDPQQPEKPVLGDEGAAEPIPEPEPEPETAKADEHEEYSKSVKKRIDKLTAKLREAERREQAATQFAENVKKENETLIQQKTNLDSSYIVAEANRISAETEATKNLLRKANEEADIEAQTNAQQKLAALAVEAQRVQALNQERTARAAQTEQVTQDIPRGPEPQLQEYSEPDPKAQAWAEENPWFGNDKAMTMTSFAFHEDLLSEGFDPTSDEYYSEINNRIRKEFPHKFNEEETQTSQPAQTVAPAKRSAKPGRKTVRLTPSQVAIANKLGVPLEEYAKYVE